jgi:hypothetical protein
MLVRPTPKKSIKKFRMRASTFECVGSCTHIRLQVALGQLINGEQRERLVDESKHVVLDSHVSSPSIIMSERASDSEPTAGREKIVRGWRE